MDRFLGKRLDGRYELSEIIGQGGMAVVYKAYDTIDERVVAVKILKEEFVANDEFKRRFKNESKAIAVLSHPNIVKVYDVSFGDVLQYIVMEYCSGITLKEYIESRGALSWEEAALFSVQALKALGHAHEKGIVHRDIKPQNMILLGDGTIKVADFGIARFSRSEQKTITDKAIGSVHYISPEQARGDNTDGKSDIYSVGVLLYEMTTGKLPFQADSAVSVAIMQLQNEPVRPREINELIPVGLEQIILNAMQKEPLNRYPTAYDMLRDIEEIRKDPFATFDNRNFATAAVAAVAPPKEDDYEFAQTKYVPSEYSKPEARQKKSKAVPILTAIAAVFVVGLGLFAAWLLFSPPPGEIRLPSFVGRQLEEVREEYNLNFVIEGDDYSDEHPIGAIINQSPPRGTMVRENARVGVYISRGAVQIRVPDTAGREFEEVREELEEYGLVVIRDDIYDDNVQRDFVIRTNPAGGLFVSAGDEITVFVSQGEEQFPATVPNLRGMQLERARQEIINSGLRVGNITYITDDMPSGMVVSQRPRSGAEAAVGDEVVLYVSRGRAVTTTTTEPTTTEPEPENGEDTEAE